jgi:hypothetical protein
LSALRKLEEKVLKGAGEQGSRGDGEKKTL